eukprot:1220169-Amphidinium_carterae.1
MLSIILYGMSDMFLSDTSILEEHADDGTIRLNMLEEHANDGTLQFDIPGEDANYCILYLATFRPSWKTMPMM